jgi:hypothetical protein
MKTNKTDAEMMLYLLKKVGPIDMESVIAAKEGPAGKVLVTLGGRRASDQEVLNLKKEADMFEHTSLFKVLTETLRYQAQKSMFLESQRSEDIFISGKFLLHAISTLEFIIGACKNPLLLSDQRPVTRSPQRPVDSGRGQN